MRGKIIFVAGIGVGYVLGAKAGRERYDQLRAQFDKVRNDPRVQEKAHQAADLAKEKAPVVKDKVTEAAGAATDKVKSVKNGDGSTDGLNPDRLKVTEETGPQGPLP